MRNEGDDDRTSGQVLGEQRWTVRGRIVGMGGSRIAKLLVVAPLHWRLHLFIRAWINFLYTAPIGLLATESCHRIMPQNQDTGSGQNRTSQPHHLLQDQPRNHATEEPCHRINDAVVRGF